MVTNTVPQAAPSGYREEHDSALHPAADWKKQRNIIVSGHRIRKWFGVSSTALIGAAALAPSAFGIPAALQPWVYLVSIFWFLAFCAGMFEL
jgi:hypothetical protein